MKILLILAFFSVVVYILTKKLDSKVLTGGILFLLGGVFGLFIPLSSSNELLLHKLIYNITPAVLFLLFLKRDFANWLGNSGIGCSCEVGAKNYWSVVILALLSTLTIQLVIQMLQLPYAFFASVLLAAITGFAASFTRLRCLASLEEITTTLLYLLLVSGGFWLSSL